MNNLISNRVFSTMKKDENILEKVVDVLNQGDVQSVKEISEQVEVNPMFLSGFLHALHEVEVLEKKIVGGTHIYQIKDSELLDQLVPRRSGGL